MEPVWAGRSANFSPMTHLISHYNIRNSKRSFWGHAFLFDKHSVTHIFFLRDGPLEKWWGGGGGFSARTIFFFRPLLVQEFFLQVKPSARIFFFFSDKYCFVCHLLIKKNYFTKELLYFAGFNNNWRPFFNNYIKDLKSNVMYCLLFSDCFLFTIHFLTAIHIECFINVGVK